MSKSVQNIFPNKMKTAIFFNLLMFCISVHGAVTTFIPNKLFVDESDFFQIAQNVTPCNEDDPELSECVKRAFVVMKPDILDLLPPDPTTLTSEQSNIANSVLKGGSKLDNIKIYGKRDFEVRDIRLKIGRILEIDLDIFYPQIAVEANILINTTENQRNAYINETMTGVELKHHWIGHLITVNNRKFIEIDSLQSKANMEKMEIHLSGIGKTPEQDEQIQSILNRQWRKIESMYLEQLENRMAPVSKANINALLRIIPYNSVIKGNSQYYQYDAVSSSASLLNFSWLFIFISMIKVHLEKIC